MRIAVAGLRGIPDVQGGVERHAQELYPRLSRLGCDVTVLARRPFVAHHLPSAGTSPAPSASPGDSYEYDGVHVVALGSPKTSGLEAFAHTLKAVMWAARRRRTVDLLHIHAVGPSLMVPLARMFGLKVITTNHGPDYARDKWGALAKRLLRTGESFGARYSTKVIAVSQAIVAALRTDYGAEAVYIPNGVTTTADGAGSDAIRRFYLDEGGYFLAVGRLVPEKGLHDLIESYAAIGGDAARAGWKLVIVGASDHESDYSDGLLKRAAEVPGVVMTGRLGGDDVAALYGGAGLFVLPSYHEGLPIVLLEALAAGSPVLVSSIPANTEVVGADFSGIFEAGDREALTALMSEGMNDGIQGGRGRFQPTSERLKEYDWDSIAERTVAVYRQALTGKLPGVRLKP